MSYLKFLGSVCVTSCLLFENIVCGMDRGKKDGTGAKNQIPSLSDRLEKLPGNPGEIVYHFASLSALFGFDEETQMCNADSKISLVNTVSKEKLQKILEILINNQNKITIDVAKNCDFCKEEKFLYLAGLLYKKCDELNMDDDFKARFLEDFFKNNKLVCSMMNDSIFCIPGI